MNAPTSLDLPPSPHDALRMDPDVRELWLDALESGDYLQGMSRLRRRGPDDVVRHCCLGVLCELALTADVVERVEVSDDGFVTYGYRTPGATDAEFGLLPHPVAGWAGLRNASPSVMTTDALGRPDRRSLARLNDAGASFTMIARLIRRYL